MRPWHPRSVAALQRLAGGVAAQLGLHQNAPAGIRIISYFRTRIFGNNATHICLRHTRKAAGLLGSLPWTDEGSFASVIMPRAALPSSQTPLATFRATDGDEAAHSHAPRLSHMLASNASLASVVQADRLLLLHLHPHRTPDRSPPPSERNRPPSQVRACNQPPASCCSPATPPKGPSPFLTER